MAISIGHTIGNYRVVKQLGHGGMGAVYMAEHPLIGKKVALKVIHRELSGNPEVLARFQNEARAVNQIGNEHIVDITDFGQTARGDFFFVMELLEGSSLAGVLERERIISLRRALRIAAQIAGALDAAHAAGILHRDLKPDNVFLVTRMGKPDFVKVLDFGLAKLLDRAGPSQLTRAGVVLGTPQYMSPEQCESKSNIDARSDVYALGVLLYQMVTGVLPFDGKTMGEILVQHVSQPPRAPRQHNPRVPPIVEALILRCLEKKPEARFQSMAELRTALLDQVSASRAAPAAAPPPGGRPRALLLGAVVGVLACLAAGVILILNNRRQPAPLPTVVVAAAPAPAAAADADAAPKGPPGTAEVAEPQRVHVSVASEPPGAEVIDEASGAALGRTPTRLVLERDTSLDLVLKLAGHEDKRQTVRASADTDILVELQKSRRPHRPRHRPDDELLAPR